MDWSLWDVLTVPLPLSSESFLPIFLLGWSKKTCNGNIESDDLALWIALTLTSPKACLCARSVRAGGSHNGISLVSTTHSSSSPSQMQLSSQASIWSSHGMLTFVQSPYKNTICGAA